MAATRIPSNLPADAVTFRAAIITADEDGVQTVAEIVEVAVDAGDVRAAARFLRTFVRSRSVMQDVATSKEIIGVAINAKGGHEVHPDLSRYLAA